jgi:hypothetical protein
VLDARVAAVARPLRESLYPDFAAYPQRATRQEASSNNWILLFLIWNSGMSRKKRIFGEGASMPRSGPKILRDWNYPVNCRYEVYETH